jgi:hypothetical protein
MLWLKRPPTPPLLALAERSSLVSQYGDFGDFADEVGENADFSGTILGVSLKLGHVLGILRLSARKRHLTKN